MVTLTQYLSSLCGAAFAACGYDASLGAVTPSDRPDICQFQCNGALQGAKIYRMPPFRIAAAVVEKIKDEKAFAKVEMAMPGFINLTVDDALIGDISEFETVDEWKADKKAKMLEEKKQHMDSMRENAALKGACDNATVDIPDCMIDRQVDYMMQDIKYRLQGSGLDWNTYLKYLNTTEDAMRLNYRAEAEARVKMQLVIEAVTKAENIEATDEEIREEIKKYAENSGMEVEAFEKNLTDSDRAYFADRVAIDKAIKLITDAAVETEEPEKAAE